MTTASNEPKSNSLLIGLYFTLFIVLVLAGVGIKRLAGHPEFVVLFHIPAAVFLVLTGMQLRKRNEKSYEAEIARLRKQLAEK